MERARVQWRRDSEIEPALRDGDVLAWDYPSPGTEMIGRSYMRLDLGVKMTILPSRTRFGMSISPSCDVKMISIVSSTSTLMCVPTDGRRNLTVDLDEFADAIEEGEFTVAEAIDGLRRCPRAFLGIEKQP